LLLWSRVSAGIRGRSSLSIPTTEARSTPGHLVRFCHARGITFSPEDVVVSEGCIGQERLDEIAKRRQSLVIKKRGSYVYIFT